jgi:alpha-1,6-mannosyltransferase
MRPQPTYRILGRMPSLDSVRRATDAWLTPRRAIVASVASIVMVSLIAATPTSPFHPVLPEQSDGPIGMIARLLLIDHIPRGALIALGFTAMAAAGLAFLLILRACELGMIPLKTVVILTLSYAAVVLLLPLLLSRDVFSYAYYGRIVSRYGGNPFDQTPANYPANDLSKWVWPGWRSTPSVYGSLFVWVAAAITSIFHSLTQTIFAFRALAIGAMLGSVWFVAKLVQQVMPSRTVYAVAFIGLNPVVLFHTLGGGHVDALVMLSLAAAAYLVATKRELPATAALTLGALVKVSAAVPLVLLIVYVVARATPERRRRVAATHMGMAAGIGLLISLPFLTLSNPTLGMVQLVQHASWIAPPELMEHVFQAMGQLMGGNTGGTIGVVIARITMYSCLALGLFLIAKQVARKAPSEDFLYLGAVWGWALLLMMLFSPTLFAWYFCWVLPVAWALPRVPRITLELSFLALVTSQLTTENFQLPGWIHVQLPIGHPVLIVLLVWFLRDLWLRMRHDVPLDADVDVVALSKSIRDGRPLVLPDAESAADVYQA